MLGRKACRFRHGRKFTTGTTRALHVAMKQILVIEDVHEGASQLALALTNEGYAPDVTNSANDAAVKIRRRLPDAIVLALDLPAGGSWNLLQSLTSGTATARVPVILLAADQGADALIRAYNAGASYYVPRPHLSSDVVHGLDLMLGRSARRSEPANSRQPLALAA